MSNFNQSFMLNGLGTFVTTLPDAGQVVVEGKLSLPQLSGGAPANSSVVVVVKQNSTTKYTGVAGAEGFRVSFIVSALDTVSIITSSSDAGDNALNAVKIRASVWMGE